VASRRVDVDTGTAPTSTPSTRRRAPGSPVDVLRHRRDPYTRRCIDWTGGQIKNDDCADDVKNVDLSQVHYLSGPIAVEGAQPGDLLKVELSNLGCLEGDEWGFTGTFHKDNGGGFLTDHYPQATKACWDIEGVYCHSRNIPGVRFAGLIHPGLIGTATEKTLCSCLATRPLACLPEPTGALLGKLGHFKHGAKLCGNQPVSYVILHAIELPQLRGQRGVHGLEIPRHRADAATETRSRRWRGAPAI